MPTVAHWDGVNALAERARSVRSVITWISRSDTHFGTLTSVPSSSNKVIVEILRFNSALIPLAYHSDGCLLDVR